MGTGKDERPGPSEPCHRRLERRVCVGFSELEGHSEPKGGHSESYGWKRVFKRREDSTGRGIQDHILEGTPLVDIAVLRERESDLSLTGS